MTDKEKILSDTVHMLEHLINSVGKVITEYHWREFSAISILLIKYFPEYNLNEVIANFYKTKRNEKDIHNSNVSSIDNQLSS